MRLFTTMPCILFAARSFQLNSSLILASSGDTEHVYKGYFYYILTICMDARLPHYAASYCSFATAWDVFQPAASLPVPQTPANSCPVIAPGVHSPDVTFWATNIAPQSGDNSAGLQSLAVCMCWKGGVIAAGGCLPARATCVCTTPGLSPDPRAARGPRWHVGPPARHGKRRPLKPAACGTRPPDHCRGCLPNAVARCPLGSGQSAGDLVCITGVGNAHGDGEWREVV